MGRTILVADDEPAVRSMLSAALSAAGYTVLVASDGQEAVDLFAAHSAEIDLTLLDLTMPRLGGDGALREIARISPGAKVYVSSGYIDDETDEVFGDLRPTGFVHKPYRIADLVRTVTEALAT